MQAVPWFQPTRVLLAAPAIKGVERLWRLPRLTSINISTRSFHAPLRYCSQASLATCSPASKNAPTPKSAVLVAVTGCEDAGCSPVPCTNPNNPEGYTAVFTNPFQPLI